MITVKTFPRYALLPDCYAFKKGLKIFLTFCCACRYAGVMVVRSDIFQGSPDGFHLRDVSVRLVRPDERTRWDRLMDQHHYLGFKCFAGRGQRYVFEWRGQWVGLAGSQSGAFKCRPRDRWISWKRELQFIHLHLIANNTRFLILGAPSCFPNLASFALAAMDRRLSADWSAAYSHSLLLAESLCRSIQVLRAYVQGGGLDAVGAHERLYPREWSIYGPAWSSEGGAIRI